MPWVTPEDEDIGSVHQAYDQEGRVNYTPQYDSPGNGGLTGKPLVSEKQDHQLDLWLQKVAAKYKTLSSHDRNRTLDHLIGISEGPQLYHLSERLNELLKRDFLSLLPQDLVLYLVRFMGAETMVTCTKVSKRWRDVIDSCNGAWKTAALSSGANLEGRTFCKTSVFRELCLSASWYSQQLKSGTSFDTSVMYGHRDRIMTVYYHNGVIATGSDDHTVRLWNCSTGVCFRILHTHSTVAAVKFDDSRIVTASFNTTATLWDLPTGEAQKEYVGHVAAVFSIDYDAKLDLLVTGSADSTIKVWLLSSAVLIKTLTHHRSTWITQVCLYWSLEQSTYSVLSRDDAIIHMWRLTNGHEVIDTRQMADAANSALLPGWQVCGPMITYTTYSEPSIYSVITLDLRKPDTPSSIVQFNIKEYVPQGFLGSGLQFTVLLHATDGERSEMTVIRNSTGEVLATTPMPLDYRPSKRSSTFTLGDRGWLDGFTSGKDLGIHLVACLRDNGILQLRWRAHPCRSHMDSSS